jgi:hypothetical protein
LFPRLDTVRYEDALPMVGGGGDGGEPESSEIGATWAQVQELVFAFQDVRRPA